MCHVFLSIVTTDFLLFLERPNISEPFKPSSGPLHNNIKYKKYVCIFLQNHMSAQITHFMTQEG